MNQTCERTHEFSCLETTPSLLNLRMQCEKDRDTQKDRDRNRETKSETHKETETQRDTKRQREECCPLSFPFSGPWPTVWCHSCSRGGVGLSTHSVTHSSSFPSRARLSITSLMCLGPNYFTLGPYYSLPLRYEGPMDGTG